MTGIVVTMRHVRAAGLCANGLRGWFDQYDRGLIRRFCRDGLPVEEVEALGGHYAMTVAALAREEAAHG